MVFTAPQFTFVGVEFGEEDIGVLRRGRGISSKDRVKIRSLAAADRGKHRLRESDREACPEPWQRQAKSQSTCSATKRRNTKRALIGSAANTVLRAQTLPTPPLDYYDDGFVDLADIEYTVDTPGALTHIDNVRGATSLPDDLEFYVTSKYKDQDVDEQYEERQSSIDPFAVAMAKSFQHQMLRSEKLDPFWTFAVPYRPWLSSAIHFRTNDLCPPGIPGLDGKDENTMLSLFSRCMEYTGYMCAAALMGAAQLHKRKLEHGVISTVTSKDLVWLRGCAYGGINSDLATIDAFTPAAKIEACLGAILSMGFYENAFGDPSLSAVHIAGCERLIELVGGLEMLSPLLQRALNWMAGAGEPLSQGAQAPWLERAMKGRFICVPTAVSAKHAR